MRKFKNIGVIIKKEFANFQKLKKDLNNWLESRDYVMHSIENLDNSYFFTHQTEDLVNNFINKIDVLIVFGGDGTFLLGARIIQNQDIPIIGVNLGKVGFLAEISLKNMFAELEDILNGQFLSQDRIVLEGILETQPDQKFYSLNDIVISNSGLARVITITLYVDNEFLNEYHADGFIIATPTGSTAYSLSANGPIVAPNIPLIILNPICPHSLNVRPLIVPLDSEIRIHVETKIDGNIYLTIDGQRGRYLESGDNIIIKTAPIKTRIIHTEKWSFYKILKEKLNWGPSILQTVENKYD